MKLRKGFLIINSLQNLKVQGFKARNLIWEESLSPAHSSNWIGEEGGRDAGFNGGFKSFRVLGAITNFRRIAVTFSGAP